MSKWNKWYEAQPQHIREWIDQPRAIWYDSDMWKAGVTGAVIGLIIGMII